MYLIYTSRDILSTVEALNLYYAVLWWLPLRPGCESSLRTRQLMRATDYSYLACATNWTCSVTQFAWERNELLISYFKPLISQLPKVGRLIVEPSPFNVIALDGPLRGWIIQMPFLVHPYFIKGTHPPNLKSQGAAVWSPTQCLSVSQWGFWFQNLSNMLIDFYLIFDFQNGFTDCIANVCHFLLIFINLTKYCGLAVFILFLFITDFTKKGFSIWQILFVTILIVRSVVLCRQSTALWISWVTSSEEST